MSDKPLLHSPGSPKAIAAGCACSPEANHGGRGMHFIYVDPRFGFKLPRQPDNLEWDFAWLCPYHTFDKSSDTYVELT